MEQMRFSVFAILRYRRSFWWQHQPSLRNIQGPLITSPYISRVLLPTNLGIYSYIDSVAQIFAVIGALGLTNYGIREIAYVKDDKEKRSQIFFEIMILKIILLIVTFILYYMFFIGTQYEKYSMYQLIWFIGNLVL